MIASLTSGVIWALILIQPDGKQFDVLRTFDNPRACMMTRDQTEVTNGELECVERLAI